MWLREILGMKPSWAVGFAATDDYVVDLGSGQSNVVDAKTGVQVPGYQTPFDFATVKVEEVVSSIKSFIDEKDSQGLKVFATGLWRTNRPRFEELKAAAKVCDKIQVEVLTEPQEARYGGQSIANVLEAMKPKFQIEVPNLVLSIESGKGSTQACFLVGRGK
eukprot:c3646_g1_i1.p1 GENE.c3646_g1_i1~~c3646_g1_i1.p1  ORF type:complete len:162 (-),score=35.41 c3646_g1_i1:255-740(-)